MDPWYETDLGVMLRGTVEELDVEADLIFTSPPWRPHALGWYARVFRRLATRLTAQGSMVVVLGNEWCPPPYQTTRTLDTLKMISQSCGLDLAQMFVAVHDRQLMSSSVADRMVDHIGRTRVPDIHSHAWWLTRRPKVSQLHASTTGSVIDASSQPADWKYEQHCLDHNHEVHPAAMPFAFPSFFVTLLTAPGDLVVDPFAGSNTTGAAAESLGRRWVSLEPDGRYVAGSRGRFLKVRQHV